MFGERIRNRKKLLEICRPISGELSKADKEFKSIVTDYESNGFRTEWKKLYKVPGRMLRQAVFMLPVKAVGMQGGEESSTRLVKLSAAAETIFCAVKLHEEIGSASTGSELSVLMGDRLQALSLLVLSDILPVELVQSAVQHMEKACYMQIEEVMKAEAFESKEQYIDRIRRKEDSFTAVFRTFAGYLTGAGTVELDVLEKCMQNFGIASKLLEDKRNGSLRGLEVDVDSEINLLAGETKLVLSGLKDDIYKEKLLELVDYLNNYMKYDAKP